MIGFTAVVMSDQRYRGIDKDRARAYYGAQSGLEKLTTDMGNLFLTNVAPTNAQVTALGNNPPSIPSVTFVAPAGVTAYGITPIPCLPPATFTCCRNQSRRSVSMRIVMRVFPGGTGTTAPRRPFEKS